MTFGTWDDAVMMRACFTNDVIREALRTAPPGVFDARSWHYWHHVVGIHDVPERPVRRIPGVEPSPPTSKYEWAREFRSERT